MPTDDNSNNPLTSEIKEAPATLESIMSELKALREDFRRFKEGEFKSLKLNLQQSYFTNRATKKGVVMAEQEKPKDDKKTDGEKTPQKFKTIEEANAYIEGLHGRLETSENEKRELLHETMARKEKLRALEKEKTDAEQKTLEEQNKYKELYQTVKPKVDRLEKMEPVLNSLLELEMQGIPEEKRDLVPQLDVVEKIQWIRTAQSKGLFTSPKEEPKKSPVGTVQSKTTADGTTPEYVNYAANDPRLSQLSLAEYEIWKRHNRKSDTTKVRGWGG